MLWINIVGWITLQKFTLALKLTLDKATITNKFNVSHTVVDVMSWVTEITDLEKNAVLIDPRSNKYWYTGTFLHQPVDLISTESVNDLFVEQVIKVSLQTSHRSDPQKMIRQAIRDQIYSTLTNPDVITGITHRDSINSMVSSWLLGGIADDIANTDDNNVVIQDIRIPEDAPDTLAIEYMGPRNVFVPKRPADWPTGYDFSPGSLANIQHIEIGRAS